MKELGPASLRRTLNDRPPRVLVVEDETALALLLVYNLQSKGFMGCALRHPVRPWIG
jgi:two-component system phosphate regulon response regulator PhoB